MGKGEDEAKSAKGSSNSKTAKVEGSHSTKKPDKGGLGKPLYEPAEGEANVEYVCCYYWYSTAAS